MPRHSTAGELAAAAFAAAPPDCSRVMKRSSGCVTTSATAPDAQPARKSSTDSAMG